MKGVDIFLMDDRAYVVVGNNYLLCIGSAKVAQKANADQLTRMIQEALAHNRFLQIETSKGLIVH